MHGDGGKVGGQVPIARAAERTALPALPHRLTTLQPSCFCPCRDVHMACPLNRLTAVKHCELIRCVKWDSVASLPPSITSLVLRHTFDNWCRLPPQVRLLGVAGKRQGMPAPPFGATPTDERS